MPAGIRHRARLNQNKRIRPQTRSSGFKSVLVACGSRGRGAPPGRDEVASLAERLGQLAVEPSLAAARSAAPACSLPEHV
eukprot:9204625-Alexandrium_andersonii.AAC.1